MGEHELIVNMDDGEREVIEDVGEGGSGIDRENESGQKLGTLANLKLPLPMKVRGIPKGLALTVVGKRKKPRGDQNKMNNRSCKIDAVPRDELGEDVRGERGTEQILENEMIGHVCNGNNMNMKRKRSEKKNLE